MSKSSYQIIKFIEQYDFKSEIDWKGISSLCKLELDTNLDDIIPVFSPDGIDFAMFSSWFNDGFGSGDIACFEGKSVIIGACNLSVAKIEATLIGEVIDNTRFSTDIMNLSRLSVNEIAIFKKALFVNELQYGESNQLVIQRYIPIANERVSFKTDDMYGIGVIRSVSKVDDTIELYCYYIYGLGSIKYSMHETIGSLSDYIFQPMSRSERNRLKNELKKCGKNWNDKIHRIEPVEGKAGQGTKYWYINDKMKMVSDIEEGKPTSHFRFIGGNYFLTQDDCLENLGAFNEILRNFLAR